MGFDFYPVDDPLKYPGDGDLDKVDQIIAATATMNERAGFDWHAWAASKSPKQAGDMLAVLAWRLRCEVANNVALGKVMEQREKNIIAELGG